MDNLIPAITPEDKACYINADNVEAIVIEQGKYSVIGISGKAYRIVGGFETLKMVIKDSAWRE